MKCTNLVLAVFVAALTSSPLAIPAPTNDGTENIEEFYRPVPSSLLNPNQSPVTGPNPVNNGVRVHGVRGRGGNNAFLSTREEDDTDIYCTRGTKYDTPRQSVQSNIAKLRAKTSGQPPALGSDVTQRPSPSQNYNSWLLCRNLSANTYFTKDCKVVLCEDHSSIEWCRYEETGPKSVSLFGPNPDMVPSWSMLADAAQLVLEYSRLYKLLIRVIVSPH
ncbi:hypothetical protein DHEL01_v210785 [Diaporthe helianthi]|uniref:Uncharacterized protein n=1 Tax=Diaporthe helianthi TaxID=158607 RepID=A0A2P5HKP1_DIAHE|nr:hypothetical protein DHEL01_v210785 [Diaporthe helianthi]